jgi:hypothetical protein
MNQAAVESLGTICSKAHALNHRKPNSSGGWGKTDLDALVVGSMMKAAAAAARTSGGCYDNVGPARTEQYAGQDCCYYGWYVRIPMKADSCSD